jgi:hypothetical protein
MRTIRYPDAGHYVLEDAGELAIADIRETLKGKNG